MLLYQLKIVTLQIVLVTAYEPHSIVLGENKQVSETITLIGTECTETETVNMFIFCIYSTLGDKNLKFF